MKKITTLINTLTSTKGELFVIGHGRRILLACCRPEIRVYEKNEQLPLLGKPGYGRKTLRFMIALCGEMEFNYSGNEFMGDAERYELTADLLRSDGIFERFYFHNISLVEINDAGEWEFELNVTEEQRRKLSGMAEGR